MCLAPITLKDRTQVACRYCDWCKSNRLNDLIGRCVAEQSTASKAYAVTLTYGGDVPSAALLRYSDVQNFLKRLRKDNYSVRYICAGEYGSKKGRAHWHIILFFYGKTPEIDIERRVDWKYWHHGFAYFQHPDYKGFRYVMKYALKDTQDNSAVKALSMSKKPPLGYDFFMKLASDLVERGLALHSPEYSFAHVRDKDMRPRKYWLQGRMREMFLERYCSLWTDKYKTDPPETEFLMEKYLDPICKKEMENDPLRLEREKQYRDAAYLKAFIAARKAEYSEKRRETGMLVLRSGSDNFIVAYSDNMASLFIGDQECVIDFNGNGVTVHAQLQRSGLMKREAQSVALWLASKWIKPD